MAWIESHQELARHPKTRRLARKLSISLPQAVGHLHFVWWWAMDFAEDGDLSAFDAADIADAAMWEGDPDAFVIALTEAGFIDDDNTIHDWWEYAGRLIDIRRKDAERKRKARGQAPHVQRMSGGHPADGGGSPPVTLTQPNPTEPNPTEPERGADAPETPAVAVAAPRNTRERKRILPQSPEQYEQMRADFPEIGDFEEVVALARAHDAARKVSDENLYLRNWLRREREIRQRKGGNGYAVNGGNPGQRAVKRDEYSLRGV